MVRASSRAPEVAGVPWPNGVVGRRRDALDAKTSGAAAAGRTGGSGGLASSAVTSGMDAARASPTADADSSRGWASEPREDGAATGATGAVAPLCAEAAAAATTCSTTETSTLSFFFADDCGLTSNEDAKYLTQIQEQGQERTITGPRRRSSSSGSSTGALPVQLETRSWEKVSTWLTPAGWQQRRRSVITHKCRGSQQLSRVKYSTQIY